MGGTGRRRGLVLILALAIAGAALTLAPVAGAGPPARETGHVEGADQFADFCDVAGLTVDYTLAFDYKLQVAARGPQGSFYYQQHSTLHERWSANGRTVTGTSNVMEKDLRITDNGDGTFTILVFATGNATIFGPDGKAIARNPGQYRYQLVFDVHGPGDEDDELLSFEVVKESTGRSDEACGALVGALT